MLESVMGFLEAKNITLFRDPFDVLQLFLARLLTGGWRAK